MSGRVETTMRAARDYLVQRALIASPAPPAPRQPWAPRPLTVRRRRASTPPPPAPPAPRINLITVEEAHADLQ